MQIDGDRGFGGGERRAEVAVNRFAVVNFGAVVVRGQNPRAERAKFDERRVERLDETAFIFQRFGQRKRCYSPG